MVCALESNSMPSLESRMRKADKQALREALLRGLTLELGGEAEKLADLCLEVIEPVVKGIVAETTRPFRPFYEGKGGTKVRVGDTVRFP